MIKQSAQVWRLAGGEWAVS